LGIAGAVNAIEPETVELRYTDCPILAVVNPTAGTLTVPDV
jgi:hypothetical protein